MNIDLLDVLALDNNNEYIVGGKSVRGEENYYLLINKNNVEDLIICSNKNNDSLTEIDDPEMIKVLLAEFYKSVKDSHILDEFNIKLPDLTENA